jgi:repressor LexA
MVNKLQKKLTDRQAMVLEAIEGFMGSRGYAPTVRQLGELLDISNPSAVFKHIISLEKKGFLTRVDGEIRLIEPPVPEEPFVRVPLVGLVPAGHAREVFESSGDALDVPEWMVGRKKGNIFCITVDGKSMVDAYIDDGDRVLVERTSTASSGEMIIASLEDGSVTLKRLRIENGSIFLVPENPSFEPFAVSDLKILGRVIGVLRKY